MNRQISNLCRIVFADRGLTGNPEVIPVQKLFRSRSGFWEAVIWQGRPCFQWN